MAQAKHRDGAHKERKKRKRKPRVKKVSSVVAGHRERTKMVPAGLHPQRALQQASRCVSDQLPARWLSKAK